MHTVAQATLPAHQLHRVAVAIAKHFTHDKRSPATNEAFYLIKLI
jgi:hypothetical protein